MRGRLRCGEDHDPETHLIPNVLAAAADPQKEVKVLGNQYPTPDGTPIRDYIHVADLADAHIRSLDYLQRGGASDALNLGTGEGNSVLEVIETARRVTGRPIRIRIEGPRPGDPGPFQAVWGLQCHDLGAGAVQLLDDPHRERIVTADDGVAVHGLKRYCGNAGREGRR